MNDSIFETFDALFKVVHRQGRRVEELEARLEVLEKKLAERDRVPPSFSPRRKRVRPELDGRERFPAGV